MGHTNKFCAQLFDTREEDLKREWGLLAKSSDERGSDNSGDRWLRDGLGGEGQSLERGMQFIPGMQEHGQFKKKLD